jgi:hypothetical protein
MDNQFDMSQYIPYLQLLGNLYKHVQSQKHCYSVDIQLEHSLLNDESFFHHKNKHLRENVRLYTQEQFHRMSIGDLIRLHNSIVKQVHHMPLDELECDLRDKKTSMIN